MRIDSGYQRYLCSILQIIAIPLKKQMVFLFNLEHQITSLLSGSLMTFTFKLQTLSFFEPSFNVQIRDLML